MSFPYPLPVAVIGAGISGQAAIDLLAGLRIPSAQVTLFDQTPGKGAFSDPAALLTQFKPRTLLVSPGVPLSTPWIVAFEAAGGMVTSELELACAQLTTEKVVGVTGSVGKSTTVSLIGEAARSFCPDVFVGGNLGVPLAAYVADVLHGRRQRTEWVILELSSFQLEKCAGLKCVASVLTSLNRNHLERYESLEAYYETKWKLINHTRGPAVLNAHGGDLRHFAQKIIAANDDTGELIFSTPESSPLKVADFARAQLLGAHNADNIAVAATLARRLEWPLSCYEALLAYRGLPHRLELVHEAKGIRFVNDSKATAMESVLTAVNSFVHGNGQTWVLLGGRDKKLPWEKLQVLGKNSQLHFAFFGECGALAQQKSGLPGEVFGKMRGALESLHGRAKAGDIVLLSPGGTSLDEFKGFEDRGRNFAAAVKEIWGAA
ncbi:MAG: UDP-N-acetylmuramoyl-L-alanine--D-glutamate ligase [Bdellovibrionales bacterium]|nr:UDP-N-acetylmuramoyl-L-alanine--D-glutamate ligase [Bdellovibrionales bacterium]